MLVASVATAGVLQPLAYSYPFSGPLASAPVLARSAPLVAAASPYFARSFAAPYLASPYVQQAVAAPVVARAAPYIAAPAPVVAAAPVAVARSAPVVAAAPVAVARSAEIVDAHPQYQYAYNVNDALTGDHKTQEESRDGDVVRGSYSLLEADGSRRVVNYYADPINGFNAVVQRTAPVVAPVEAVAAKVVVA